MPHCLLVANWFSLRAVSIARVNVCHGKQQILEYFCNGHETSLSPSLSFSFTQRNILLMRKFLLAFSLSKKSYIKRMSLQHVLLYKKLDVWTIIKSEFRYNNSNLCKIIAKRLLVKRDIDFSGDVLLLDL